MGALMAPLVALLAVGWLLWLLTAPFLFTPLSSAAYLIGSLVCHQLPDRSFHLGGIQLPVCARCLGIYAGSAVGAVIGAVSWSGRRATPAAPMSARTVRWMLAVVAAPTLASVLLETADVWRTTNVERAVAGLPLGLGAALVVISALATLHYKRDNTRT
jgi:uncharacterized membrane protein